MFIHFKELVTKLLYRSKFSRGSNFRYFREVPLIRENKNLAKISVLSKWF